MTPAKNCEWSLLLSYCVGLLHDYGSGRVNHTPLPTMQLRYVFLDRDGVINRKPQEGEYIDRWDKFQILPGVESAIAGLNRSGRQAIVVTNQRGIALGLYTALDVEAIHNRLQEHLRRHNAHIDAFYFCPHDKNQCNCRKPRTGMLEQAFHDFPEASPANSIMIGDSISDIQAARACGMPSIFIAGDPATQKPGADQAMLMADSTAASLWDAVDRFLI